MSQVSKLNCRHARFNYNLPTRYIVYCTLLPIIHAKINFFYTANLITGTGCVSHLHKISEGVFFSLFFSYFFLFSIFNLFKGKKNLISNTLYLSACESKNIIYREKVRGNVAKRYALGLYNICHIQIPHKVFLICIRIYSLKGGRLIHPSCSYITVYIKTLLAMIL